jgi:hypothetical protein
MSTTGSIAGSTTKRYRLDTSVQVPSTSRRTHDDSELYKEVEVFETQTYHWVSEPLHSTFDPRTGCTIVRGLLSGCSNLWPQFYDSRPMHRERLPALSLKGLGASTHRSFQSDGVLASRCAGGFQRAGR